MAAIDGLGATHETRAFGATDLLLLPRPAFIRILEAHPALYAVFARMLCHRLRKAHGLVDEFAMVPLRKRLARNWPRSPRPASAATTCGCRSPRRSSA